MMVVAGSGTGNAEGQSPGLYVTSRASGTPESFVPAATYQEMKLSATECMCVCNGKISVDASGTGAPCPGHSIGERAHHTTEVLKGKSDMRTLKGERSPPLLQDLWPGYNGS